jgi:predicted nucleic acid-binding protein
MSAVRRIYVDTNIYIIMFESKDERQNRLTDALIPKSPDDFSLVASLLTYAELLVGPLKSGNSVLLASYETLFDETTILQVVPVDRSVLHDAARLRARYQTLKLPDDIHAASAIHAGCSHLISDEKRFPPMFELDMASADGGVTITTLRPEADGLDMLEQLLAS